MRETILYVSPHLDDAAWSCAGRLLADVRRGRRVVVVSVFTAGEPRRLYRRRRQEDRRALTPLGIEIEHLGLEDAPTRLGRGLSFAELCLAAPPSQRDREQVRLSVEPIVERLGPTRIWAPLGVGNHVDHLAVHEALVDRPDVCFYFDRPYAFAPSLVRGRLGQVALSDQALAAELEDGGLGRLLSGSPLPPIALLAAEGPLEVAEDRFEPAGVWELLAAYRSQWRSLPGIGQAFTRAAIDGATWCERSARRCDRPGRRG